MVRLPRPHTPKSGESGVRLSSPEFPRLFDDEDTEVSRTTAVIAAVIRSCRRPRLTVMTGLRAGTVVPLDDKEQYVVGRGRDSDVHVQDPGISRHHCRFIR